MEITKAQSQEVVPNLNPKTGAVRIEHYRG